MVGARLAGVGEDLAAALMYTFLRHVGQLAEWNHCLPEVDVSWRANRAAEY